MGCLCSETSAEEQLKRTLSLGIDKQIQEEMREMRRTIKLLLLGAGEAGKSTMVKQMKIWHEKGYTEQERKDLIPHIHSNLLEAIIKLIQARRQNDFKLSRPENVANENLILASEPVALEAPIFLTPKLFHTIAALWPDQGIQQAFEIRKEILLSDSVAYFMNRLELIQRTDYLPDQQDVLRVRVRTTAITEYNLVIKKSKFRIVDVGGQRTERRKWIHCFEGVNYIFYVASLSDYNKTLKEDRASNRMQESLALFSVILQEDSLKHSSVILFLNKMDIFEEEIQNHHLADYFPGYTGPIRSVKEAQEYILDLYMSCNNRPNRRIFSHYTCAVDTEQFQKVFKTVRYHIIDSALHDSAADPV